MRTSEIHWTPGDLRVRVPRDEALLFSLLSAGLELDFGCMYGVCRGCLAHVAAGRVRHGDALGLTPGERRAGHALLCAAYPVSAQLVLSPAGAKLLAVSRQLSVQGLVLLTADS